MNHSFFPEFSKEHEGFAMYVTYPDWWVKLKDKQTELRVKGDPRSLSQRRHQNEPPKRGGWEDLDKTAWELMRSGEMD